MSTKRTDLVEFNIYLDLDLRDRLKKLQESGLSMSAVARLAVRKCSNGPLDNEVAGNMPKRVQLYLHPDEVLMLDQAVAREGESSKGKMMRRFISTYLRIHSASIEAMF